MLKFYSFCTTQYLHIPSLLIFENRFTLDSIAILQITECFGSHLFININHAFVNSYLKKPFAVFLQDGAVAGRSRASMFQVVVGVPSSNPGEGRFFFCFRDGELSINRIDGYVVSNK